MGVNGTWADGINIHGQHRNTLVQNCTVRYSSGDDSFAIWSVGAGADNITFRDNAAYPHGSSNGLAPACAMPCPCDNETWDGIRFCHCPGAPKEACCRAAGCFANYGGQGQASVYENNKGFQCNGAGGLVNFGDKWCAIHGTRELDGLFGGAWNSSSSTRVVGNNTVDGSSAWQCSFEAPVDPKTKKSV
jgi:hypothetical protein